MGHDTGRLCILLYRTESFFPGACSVVALYKEHYDEAFEFASALNDVESVEWNSGQAISLSEACVKFISSRYHRMLYWPNKCTISPQLPPPILLKMLRSLSENLFSTSQNLGHENLPHEYIAQKLHFNASRETQQWSSITEMVSLTAGLPSSLFYKKFKSSSHSFRHFHRRPWIFVFPRKLLSSKTGRNVKWKALCVCVCVFTFPTSYPKVRNKNSIFPIWSRKKNVPFPSTNNRLTAHWIWRKIECI